MLYNCFYCTNIPIRLVCVNYYCNIFIIIS